MVTADAVAILTIESVLLAYQVPLSVSVHQVPLEPELSSMSKPPDLPFSSDQVPVSSSGSFSQVPCVPSVCSQVPDS